MLRHDEQLNEITNECACHHRIGETWSSCPSPQSKDLVIAVSSKHYDCCLWKLDEICNLDDDHSNDNPIGIN